MPDPLERRCALYILIPNRSRACPDGTALTLALGDRLAQLHIVAWTGGPEPDRTCVRRAAEAADLLEASTGTWPRYEELCDAAAVIEPDPAVDIIVALAADERRRTHRAARALAVRSNAHFAVVTTTGQGVVLRAGHA